MFVRVAMPAFEVEPAESALVDRGQMLVLDCTASGEPKPNISWYRGSVQNPLSTGEDRVTVLANSSLRCVAKHLQSGTQGRINH